jgi:hypothetical protein
VTEPDLCLGARVAAHPAEEVVRERGAVLLAEEVEHGDAVKAVEYDEPPASGVEVERSQAKVTP